MLPVFFVASLTYSPALVLWILEALAAHVSGIPLAEKIDESQLDQAFGILSAVYYLAFFNVGRGDHFIPLFQVFLAYCSNDLHKRACLSLLLGSLQLSLGLFLNGRAQLVIKGNQELYRRQTSFSGIYSGAKVSKLSQTQYFAQLIKQCEKYLSTLDTLPASDHESRRLFVHTAFQACAGFISFFVSPEEPNELDPIERAKMLIALLSSKKDADDVIFLSPDERAYLINESIEAFAVLSSSVRLKVLFDRFVLIVATHARFPFKAFLIELFQKRRPDWVLSICSKTRRGVLDVDCYRNPAIEFILDEKAQLPKLLRKKRGQSNVDYLVLLGANREQLPQLITQALSVIDICDEGAAWIRRRCRLMARTAICFMPSTDNAIVPTNPPEVLLPTDSSAETWINDLLARMRLLFDWCQLAFKSQGLTVLPVIGLFLQSFSQLASGLLVYFLSKPMPPSLSEESPLLNGSGHVWGAVSLMQNAKLISDFWSHAWLRHPILTPDSRLLLLCYLSRYNPPQSPNRSWYYRAQCLRWMRRYTASIQQRAATVSDQP